VVLKPEPTAPLQSVQYALRVLECVARHTGGVTDVQIARETALPTGHLLPLLLMLRREGYVQQAGGGGYIVGESIGAAVYISRYIDGEVKITQYADGPKTPRVNEWVDFRSAAHASAVGKCLLSQLDHDGRRDHFARHKTARLTSRTITNEKVLFRKLDSQPPTGTVCAAVPITAGKSVGCLALSMPVEHAHRLRQAADALNRTAAPLLLSLSL
jgi:DNA-binding IclR family transcriptional regulator